MSRAGQMVLRVVCNYCDNVIYRGPAAIATDLECRKPGCQSQVETEAVAIATGPQTPPLESRKPLSRLEKCHLCGKIMSDFYFPKNEPARCLNQKKCAKRRNQKGPEGRQIKG